MEIHVICHFCNRSVHFMATDEAAEEIPPIFWIGCRDCRNRIKVIKPKDHYLHRNWGQVTISEASVKSYGPTI